MYFSEPYKKISNSYSYFKFRKERSNLKKPVESHSLTLKGSDCLKFSVLVPNKIFLRSDDARYFGGVRS